MRIVIVGLGNQGRKRLAVAGNDVVATVDPVVPACSHRILREVPIDTYDAAYVCTPDEPKGALLGYLLQCRKHVLVEKPLLLPEDTLLWLRGLTEGKNVILYTAYNHRFEPHIERMKELIQSGEIGQIYHCRMSYGFGTVADVKGTWRDQGLGVLSEVGTHLIDLAIDWFGMPPMLADAAQSSHRFENRQGHDYFCAMWRGQPAIKIECSWVSWKNRFQIDVFGEKGSAHIDGLTKWGSSTFTQDHRVLPSGKPVTDSIMIGAADQSWQKEHEHFDHLCRIGWSESLVQDLKIARVIRRLSDARRGSSSS